MVDFATNTIFNLTPINKKEVDENITALLISGEKIVGAYRTIRDQVIFTTMRLISMDKKGLTGKKQLYYTVPYKMIQYFSIQTAGLLELFPDSELEMWFANGRKFHFEFKGECDIIAIGKQLSEYCVKN